MIIWDLFFVSVFYGNVIGYEIYVKEVRSDFNFFDDLFEKWVKIENGL